MNLNADIIYNGLKKLYSAKMYGPKKADLSLVRPEFYMEDETVFQSDHLYLATVEHLPQRPRILQNAVLVCIGESFTLNYYRERLTLIVIKDHQDFFRVFHSLQDIFEMYNEWEKAIYSEVFNDRDIQAVLDKSWPVFKKPIYVIDKSFRIIASADSQTGLRWDTTDSGTISSESLSVFMSQSDLMMGRKETMKLNIGGIKTLCVNLFNRNDQYEGCLCISLEGNDFTDGEDKLAETLAGCLEMAIQRNPLIINDSQLSIKRIMQNLTEELPLSQSQRLLLTSSNNQETYCCLYMRYTRNSNQLPLSYVSDIVEDSFPDSAAFVYEDAVVAFVNVNRIPEKKGGSYNAALNRILNELMGQTGLCAGISNDFTDLFNIRVHYLQAQTAMENGLLFDGVGKLFYFSSYALTEMIINSLGGLPAEAYYPAGFKDLLEHDRDSGVSYLETLQVFLEENMSYTAASQKLFIHRSTLIDRISRIEKELNISLKDSDKRLQLELLLKAINIEEMLRNR